MRQKYNIDTKLIPHIGDPLDHAASSFLLNMAYELVSEDAIEVPITVKKEQLSKFVEFVKEFNIAGFDITMPHKSAIIPYLDECDEFSKIFNSVNHVKNVNGKLIGKGNDGLGMALAISETLGDMTGMTVLILGAGSVSGPIGAELCKRGCAKVIYANRTVSKAQAKAELIKDMMNVETQYGPLENDFLCEAVKDADIVVQCTSLGMAGKGQDYSSLDFMDNIKEGALCADVLYPTSKFLEKAKERNLQTVTGSEMLEYMMVDTMEFRFGVGIPKNKLSLLEDAMACAVALREVRDRRLGK